VRRPRTAARGALDTRDGLVYSETIALGRKGDAMLDLFYGLEPDIALHVSVLAVGFLTFAGVLLVTQCPRCSWLEWVGELFGDDDRERTDD
jgi:hypothetical protein